MGAQEKDTDTGRGRPAKPEALISLDARGLVYPGKRITGMEQSEYALIGGLYETYRDYRGTWKNLSLQTPAENAFHEIEQFSGRLQQWKIDDELQPAFSLSMRILPTLFDEKKNWNAFHSEVESVRKEIKSWPKFSSISESEYVGKNARIGRKSHLLHKSLRIECSSD